MEFKWFMIAIICCVCIPQIISVFKPVAHECHYKVTALDTVTNKNIEINVCAVDNVK